MKHFSVYRLDSGLFTGLVISGHGLDFDHASLYLEDGCALMEGKYDLHCEKVDLESGSVVDYQPPQPSVDHEWTGKRWNLTPEAEKAKLEDNQARKELDALDRKQVRYLGEKLAGTIDAEGERRLAEILEQKAVLRTKLKR